ncbi:hypothetical protein [Actinomadura violacea]|uniref:Uncharacterized protein n=1 Tax=Actinomadura violacea TaxID=2819934 RepID=A0ABS3RY50_9ACTN|nr:hypothetical protein [Actinomadura violacea]MBO2461686.1 hypothetical protein [Actinomadura violacea]
MAERKTKAATAKAADEEATVDPQSEDPQPGDVVPSEAEPSNAAPLEAPESKPRRLGHPESSTDFVAANAALMLPPGARHVRLHDLAGNDIDPETLYEFPAAESPSHMATVPRQVLREFTYPEASTPTSQLFYPAGAVVPVQQALKVRDALRAVAEEPEPEPRASAI